MNELSIFVPLCIVVDFSILYFPYMQYNINDVNMQNNYVIVLLIYVDMRDNIIQSTCYFGIRQ